MSTLDTFTLEDCREGVLSLSAHYSMTVVFQSRRDTTIKKPNNVEAIRFQNGVKGS